MQSTPLERRRLDRGAGKPAHIRAARKRHRFIDLIPNPAGGWYCYFLRNGKRTRLHEEFESAAWFASYAACLAGQPLPEPAAPIARVKSGTFAAMIAAYKATAEYQRFKKKRNRLASFKKLDELGISDLDIAKVPTTDVFALLDRLAAVKPGAATDLQAALNCIYKQAVAHGLIAANPLAGRKRPPPKDPLGRYSWEDSDIEQYRRHHKLGTVARLALELFLHSALRCSDAYKVGPSFIRDGEITLIQQKLERFGERARVNIPVHRDLRAALDAMTVVGQKRWLYTKTGKPFRDGDHLSDEFAKWCDDAKMPQKCRAHGLRKACAKRLIDAGVSPIDAAAITGHLDLQELLFYAAARDRRLGAKRAIAAIS